ncbi:MAG: hydantoinase B/oxoprolinase family protein [Chloroflexota bacterium]|nr:hydantoinase B/oxoprolinase family protein [Chloroflexota bacterium]
MGSRRRITATTCKVDAARGGTSSPFLFGGVDPRSGELYAHFHFEGVGWGGREGMDGNEMIVTINSNCRHTPVEVFETRYLAFLIEEYRLLPDSGGPGEFRGGLGGGNGARGGIWVKCAADTEWQTFVEAFGSISPSKFSRIRLHPGDQVRLTMPGGGGYGNPQRRDQASLAHDIEEGFVTAERAQTEYRYGQGGK